MAKLSSLVDKAQKKQRDRADELVSRIGTPENQAAAAEIQKKWDTGLSKTTQIETELPDIGGSSQGFFDRLGDTVSGGLKGSGAGFTNFGGTLLEGLGNLGSALQDKREQRQAAQDREYLAMYQKQLEEARARGDAEAERIAQIHVNQAQYRLKNSGNLGDFYDEVNRQAVGNVYKKADELAVSSAQDIERAKQGTGKVGSALVDIGAAGTQLAGDIALGMATGVGAMAPIFVRGFGSGAQQARQSGATYEQQMAYGLGSATVEVLTERLASVGKFTTKAFGTGAIDDIMKGVVKAVEERGKTAAGKAALNRLASIGTGFVGEGMEEAIAGMVDPLLQRATYSDEKIDWQQAAHDAAYQFLIGGVLGGVMGGVGGTDTSSVKTAKPKSEAPSVKPAAETTTSPAAAPEVQQAQAQAEVTKAQNPEAEVLDAATTLFTQQGMNLKTAQKRAEIVGKLVRGEEVSDKDLNRIDPTSNQTKQIFTQLTGVQFPEGKIQIEKLRDLYRSAHPVAEAAKTAEQQALERANVMTAQYNRTPVTQLSDEQILERAKQARSAANPEAEAQAAQILAQARGEIAPDNTPLLSYKDFSARHKQVFPDASPQETARMYDLYLKENQTISFMGRRMTRQQVLSTLNNAPGVERLTAEERAQIEADLNAKFDAELEAQKRDGKDAVEHSDRRRRTEVREKVQRSVNDWKKVLTNNSSVKDIVLDESMAENENAFITSDGVVHLNANRMTSEADVAYVLGHELVHSVKDTDARKAMVNDIIETVRKITEPSESREDAIERYRKMYQEHENQVAARANREAQTISFEYAEEEYAADLMREVFLSGDMLNKLAAEKPSLMARIQEILQKWISSLKGNNEAVELYNDLTALQDRFVQALRTDAAQQKLALENAGVQVDANTESARHDRYSLDTWLESDYMTDPENAAKALAKAIGVSDKKAAKYIKDVNGVAKLIADNKTLLDYEAAPGMSSFVSNTEYGGSVDFSTICKKRRLFTGTFTAIQKALPNTALTSDEMIDIRKRMKDAGHEVSCGLCYVEGSRLNLGQYATEFLDKYTTEDHEFVPAIADLTTVDGQEELRREHPEVYEAYIGYLNTLAQRKPKVYQTATAYNGEILKKFGKDAKVEEKNKNGGLRLQSFSDFEIIHLIDNMQVIMDMARVGLAGQAYTKVPDFAWAMGNTGLKINLSLIAKDVDADGHLVFDDVEGMPHEEAKKLRDAYSDNVGTIIVVFNDAQLKAAMADDFIDYIIPFHRSQLNKTQYDGLGLPKGAKDYTTVQNESYIEPVLNKNGKKTRPENYMPNKYWDFNKSGKENAEDYLKMCAENNRRPKFSNVLEYNGDGSYSLPADGSADGYWKLLIDFKMYNNDGVGVPQQPVKPDFNIDEANRMLSEYKGGHSNFPVAQDIVDEFVADYKKNHPDVRYSVGYWKPNLDSAEWDIVKSVMSNGRGTNLTAIDRMFFEKTKGKTLFGIYSTDDDTLLYASRDEDAAREHQFVTLAAEEYENGRLTDTSAEGLRAWGEAVRLQLDADSDHAGDAVASGRLGGDADVYGEQPRLYASTALRNVLENSFKTEGSRRANSVTEQPTQASEKSGAFNLDDYDIEDLLKLSDAEFQKLYDELGLDRNFEIDDDILLEDDLDIEDVAEDLDVEPEKIEILYRRAGLGGTHVAEDKQAVMTEERIDARIKEHGATRPDYARRYITRIAPKDFIDMTVYERNVDRQNFDTRVGGDFGTKMGEWDFESALRDSEEPPVLIIDKFTGQIIGHNGRHRIRALEMSGIESVEIEVQLHDEDGHMIKYDAETIPDMAVSSQFDTKIETHLSNIIPLNKAHRDEIMQSYGEKAHADAAVKYSITPQFEQWYKETYGEDVSAAHLKRRLKTAERRTEQAEHNRKAAELKNTIDSEMDLTAWMIHHTKKMREQKREFDEKLKEADKARYEAVKSAVAETKMVERAKAEVQHDADRMAERRNAAKRLHTKENVYTQKIQNLKENLKLKRNAARATLKTKALADKKRTEIETEQGVVDTLRKDPKTRSDIEKRQATAEKLRFAGREFYRTFITGAAAIERFAKRQISGMRADALVNIVGGTGSTIDRVFKAGLVDRAGNRIGDAMRDVFLCWADGARKTVDETKQALLQNYMLHLHNIDRMSFVAKAEQALRDFEEQHPWLRDMDNKEFARLVALTEKEAEKLGKQEAQALAIEYARLTKNRIEATNKPIFADDKGNAVSAETSRAIVDQYLEEHPWLEEKAQGIYEWWDLFMREWAVGQTISEAEYETMRQTYPHYVPTYRVDKAGVGGANFVGAGGATVSKAVKKAKGGFSEVMNIEDSFANIVGKIIKLNRVNELYMNIIDTAMLDNDGTFADLAAFDWESSWQTGEFEKALLDGELEDSVDAAENVNLEQVGPNEFKLTGWNNGRKYTALISKDLYQAVSHVTGYAESEREKRVLKVGRTLTTPMKMAITGVNPFFAIRNFARDVSSAYINGISGIKFPKYLKQAISEMGHNTDHWQQFQALGGTHAGYYFNEKAFSVNMADSTNAIKKVMSGLQWINENAESATRFAEYLATIDTMGDTYEARLQGIKNAAEVTVDFSRKGDAGKSINAFVPYWNPAVQGIDRMVRSVIDSPDGSKIWKQATVTLGRAALATVFWDAVQFALLNALDRYDDWEELSDRVKDTYYCIPLPNEKKFLKVPKNREWGALLGTPFMRLLEYANGRENPFENYIETSLEPNFLPPAILRPDAGGGFETDVIGFSWANDLAKNEDFAGRTIIPKALRDGSPQYQYDADTSYFSRALGKLFKEHISPMQVDYIINDYFGNWGELFTTITSEATIKGDTRLSDIIEIFTGSMFADARYSNAQANAYYAMLDELNTVVQDKKNLMGIDKYKETREYQTQKGLEKMYGNEITELNRKVRELPDGAEKDELKTQIAQLAAQALEFYEDSMSGKIENPILTAEYADLSGTVADELIRLDKYSSDYGFKPVGSAEKSYTDPKRADREYVLTKEQRDKFKEIYWELFDEMYFDEIKTSQYKKKSDEKKAETLAKLRKEVLKATKEEFFEWLKASGVRSTKKQK